MRLSTLALRLVVLALPFTWPASAAAKEPLTIDDMWAVKRVGAPSLSRDGRSMVYTIAP